MKETAVDFGIVDDMVGGVGDHKRRHLGLGSVEHNAVAGGVGGVAFGIGKGQRRGDAAVLERMQVDGIGAVAGDGDGDIGIDAVREGDGTGAGVVETANREGDGRRLGIVDDMVGGVGDHKRRHLGLVGVERDAIAGGVGGVAFGIGKGQRRGDAAVLEQCRLTV